MHAALFALTVAAFGAEPALILRGGPVFLGPDSFAQGVAVTGNRIEAVGSAAEISKLAGPKTKIVELAGRAVLPGFHDAHVEFFQGARSLIEVDLDGANTLELIQYRVQAFSAKNPDSLWLVGRGWNVDELGRRPTRFDLDAAVSTRPVALMDFAGRMLLLNTEALKRAGITRQTPKLTRGEIVRDAEGKPTGLFVEDAIGIARRAIPRPSRALMLEGTRRALALARSRGVTSAQSMPGASDIPLADQLDIWRELYKGKETTMRLFLFGELDDASKAAALRKSATDFPRSRLSVEGVSGALDGSLREHTAALLEPYFDEPKLRVKPAYTNFGLNGAVQDAHENGLQVALRVAGDRAARMALDACERSAQRAKKTGLVLPLFPCRLEGLDVVHGDDVPRFAREDALASMQPASLVFANEEVNYHANRLGDRVRLSFPWKTLEDARAPLAFGSDWPHAPLSPFDLLYAAVTRRNRNGRPPEGWVPAQKITLTSAVLHSTLDAARAVNRAQELGSIKPGKLADLVVLDRDPFTAPAEELLDLAVDYTIFDGKIVFERSAK